MSNQFNQLTPAQAERLAILAEECGEVIQVIGKILRHGFNSVHPDGGNNNRELLEIEIGHILASAAMLYDNDINWGFVSKSEFEKRKKLVCWTHHQKYTQPQPQALHSLRKRDCGDLENSHD